MRLIQLALIVGVIAFTPSRASAQAQQPFEDLGRRVKVGDQLRVEDRSGAKTTGRLTTLTAEEMILETDAGKQGYSRDAVATVAVRRSYAWMGALVGAGVGAIVGWVTDEEHHDFDLPALLGAGAGAITGALIPRMKTVYRGAAREASFAPEFSRRRAGVQVVLLW